MKKIRILIIAGVLLGLLIPTAVIAAGNFFCSDLIASGGNGTLANPWACSNDQQFNQVVYDFICNRYGGGNLYRIFTDSYIYYRIEWISQNNQRTCTIVYQSEYPGYPPNTGPDIPIPLVMGSAVTGGAVLIVAGLALRKKRAAL